MVPKELQTQLLSNKGICAACGYEYVLCLRATRPLIPRHRHSSTCQTTAACKRSRYHSRSTVPPTKLFAAAFHELRKPMEAAKPRLSAAKFETIDLQGGRASSLYQERKLRSNRLPLEPSPMPRVVPRTRCRADDQCLALRALHIPCRRQASSFPASQSSVRPAHGCKPRRYHLHLLVFRNRIFFAMSDGLCKAMIFVTSLV